VTEILAQTIDRKLYLRSMHEQFSNSDPHIWWEILLGLTIVGGIVALVWVAWFWQRWHSDRAELRPLSLYRQVLAKTGLSAGELWRLKRLAMVVRMPNPTAALISPGLYDEAVEQYCSSRGLFGSRRGAAGQFAAIRTRLFPPDTN
jgi:hypothetical protein